MQLTEGKGNTDIKTQKHGGSQVLNFAQRCCIPSVLGLSSATGNKQSSVGMFSDERRVRAGTEVLASQPPWMKHFKVSN